MTYFIIAAKRPSELVELVQQSINAGWVPLGGVAVTTKAHGDEQFFQAMIRETKP